MWHSPRATQCGKIAIMASKLDSNVEYASPGIRLGSYFLEAVLMVCTLCIGWLLWALTTAGKGQTPAKKLLSLTVVDERTHKPLGTGRMFWMRGVLAFIPGFAISLTLGILAFMPLWDGRNQNLIDKWSSAVVLKNAPETESPPAVREVEASPEPVPIEPTNPIQN